MERIRTLDTLLRSFITYHSWAISSATTQPLRILEPDDVALGGGRTDLDTISTRAIPIKDEHLHADIIVLANGFEATH